MKPLQLVLFLTAAILPVSAETGTPDLGLKLNGHANSSSPLKITRGEPMIAEITLRHSEPGETQAIALDPPGGGWSSRVNVAVSDVTGASLPWRFIVAGQPSAGALLLRPDAVTTLVLRLDPSAASSPTPGIYRLAARLDLADGRGWRGVAESEAIEVEIVTATETTDDESMGRRQLWRVRDALLARDLPKAESIAEETIRLHPQRAEGLEALALVSEAKGERQLALLYINFAIARAGGAPLSQAAAAAARPSPLPVPLEYYELQQRIEQMPSNEPEPEPLPGYPDNVITAATRVPASPTPTPTRAGSSPRPTVVIANVGNAVMAGMTDDAKFLADPRGQWASGAEASSAHGNPKYGAMQATGTPDVSTYADHPETWVSAAADHGQEWLRVSFSTPVHASAVRIRQVLGPGSIVKIEVLSADGKSATVWSGRDRNVYPKNQISWLVATFPAPDFLVKEVKLTLDTVLVLGWNSIDAVQLVGDP